MTNCVFSQTGYPKLILYQGDTVVAITKRQLRTVNMMKVEHDRFKSLIDNLKSQTVLRDTIIQQKGQMLEELLGQKDNYVHIISNNTDLAKDLQTQIDQLQSDNKKLKIKNTLLSLASVGLAILTAIKFIL